MTADWLANVRIAIIGLGYVGLPLAVEFASKFPVTGFDLNAARIDRLRGGVDANAQVDSDALAAASKLRLTTEASELADCNVFIVTVPTPVDKLKAPDLSPLLRACENIGGLLKRGDTVIFESTVFPGCTEERCVPVLEGASGLALNEDFWVGYSPERINPGDNGHQLTEVVKVTSGSTPEAAERIDNLYASIITAGTFCAESIRVAEAAKVVENTQRDLNIALVNELAIIFNRMNIDTHAVLETAGTKWNFLRFKPGLVGGHCIGVDPYYLTYKAEEIGYRPEIILAGRRLNDRMGTYTAGQLALAMARKGIALESARVLVLGLTFKENCNDLRNSLVADLVRDMASKGCAVDIHDPLADPDEALAEYDITLTAAPQPGAYDAVVVAVGHAAFVTAGPDWARSFGKSEHILFDLKRIYPREAADLSL